LNRISQNTTCTYFAKKVDGLTFTFAVTILKRTHARTHARMDGWMDGWMDGRRVGWPPPLSIFYVLFTVYQSSLFSWTRQQRTNDNNTRVFYFGISACLERIQHAACLIVVWIDGRRCTVLYSVPASGFPAVAEKPDTYILQYSTVIRL